MIVVTPITLNDSLNPVIGCQTDGNYDSITNQGSTDLFISKYDTTGNKQWTKGLGGANGDYVYRIVHDTSENIYIGGESSGDIDSQTNSGSIDALLIKYDSNGNKQWTKLSGTSNTDIGYGLCVDGSGNTYQTGYTRSDLHNNTSIGNDDIFLIRRDTTGTRIWTKQFGSTGADVGYDCALDSYGNIYVTGNVQGSIGANTHLGSSDIVLVKLNSNGSIIWSKQYGTEKSDWGKRIKLDSDGYIYIYGMLEENTVIIMKIDSEGTVK